MKKIYVCLVSLSVVCGANAQFVNSKINNQVGKQKIQQSNEKHLTSKTTPTKGVTLWSDDFSNSAHWTMTNTSNPTQDWAIVTDPNLIPVTALKPAGFTTVSNGYAFINSDGAGQTATQNANITLVTPFSTVGNANVSVVFENSYRTYLDTRIVRVSVDGGTNWTDFVVTDGTETTGVNTANPKTTSINISSVAGNQPSVLLQFNYQGAWGWYWAIDDVKVTVTDDYDLELDDIVWGVTGTWGAEMAYYQTPTTQVQPISFAGVGRNIGAMDITDAVYTAAISSASYTSSSPDSLITTTETPDTMTVALPFTPAGTVASYTVQSTLTSALNGSSELNVANNTLPNFNFNVTNTTYARDNGTANGGIYNSGGMYETGNIYDIFADQTLYSIDVVLSTTCAVDALIRGNVYITQDATSGDFTNPVTTNDYTVMASDTGNLVSLIFATPVQLTAGSWALITVATDGGPGDDLVVGRGGLSAPHTTYFYDGVGSASQPIGWYYLTSTPMVRMNFSADAGIKQNDNTFGLNLYPNPANNQTNVSFKLNNETNVAITMTDLTGKTVYTNNLGTMNSGSHNTTINTDSLSNGVYMVNVVTNGTTSTKKLIVRK